MFNFNHILVARDLSDNSDQAVEYALELARESEATVHVVYGTFSSGDPDNVPPEAEIPDDVLLERLEASIESGTAETPSFHTDGLQVEYAVARDVAPAPAILHYAAEKQVDLIVTGTHGRTGLARLIKGSVSEQVARSAQCPVLTVRQDAHV
jgi:nucleotide-binding universal stress UspA family protein